jgi:hypothetical protein
VEHGDGGVAFFASLREILNTAEQHIGHKEISYTIISFSYSNPINPINLINSGSDKRNRRR